LASWLRTDFSVVTDYATDRNAALVEELVMGADTVLVLQRNANGNRSTRATASLDPASLLSAMSKVEEEGGEESRGIWRVLNAIDPLSVSRQGGLSARFFREPVNPGAGFQLGLGSRESLRFLDGDTASIFTGQMTWTLGTGVRLPLNLRVSGNYSDSRTQILHVRSDRELHTRAWPDLRVSITQVEIPESARRFVESLSVSSGYRKSFIETTYGGRGQQRRVNDERQIPLELNATWSGGLTTRYRGTLSRGEGEDPTGRTQTRRHTHSFLLSSSISDPPFIGGQVDGPLRVTLGYQYSSELNCRVPTSRTACVAFLDFLNRSLNLTLDTVLLPLEVGLHLTYTSRRSFVGQHDGSTQFQLGLFGQFLFDSGTFLTPGSTGEPTGF
jgi:hypothetical protein